MKKLGLAAALASTVLMSACALGTAEPPSPVGTWGAPEDGRPQLVLEPGGSVHGTDGCNRLVGGWEEIDGRIVFGQLAGTRMFCRDVDTWLSEATSARIAAGTMEFFNAENVSIGRLGNIE